MIFFALLYPFILFLIKLSKLSFFLSFLKEFFLLKVISCITLYLLFHLMRKYPLIVLDPDIEDITNKYKIHSSKDKIVSFFLVGIYVSLFGLGIFYSRIVSQNKVLDLKPLLNIIHNSILTQRLVFSMLNITLVVLLFLCFLMILFHINRFFKRYFIKLHLYYLDEKGNSPYYAYFCYPFYYHFNIYSIFSAGFGGLNHFIDAIRKTLGREHKYEKKLKKLRGLFYKANNFFAFTPLQFPFYNIFPFYSLGREYLSYHLTVIFKSIHHMIFLSFLFYDIFWNNCILSYSFHILPYIFIYDIYIRLSKLYHGLSFCLQGDVFLHEFIYAKSYVILEHSKELAINGDLVGNLYDLDEAKHFILMYLHSGLIGSVLDKYYYKRDPEAYNNKKNGKKKRKASNKIKKKKR